MKDGWVEKKLGDVCQYDKIIDRNPNLPYLGLENIESNTGKYLRSDDERQAISNTYHFTEKHVLYGRLRPYLNKVYLPDFEGRCSTEIFPIAVNDKVTREYLFYWLTSERIVERINATWTGARMPRANMNEVLTFEIPLPPLSEQKEIVARLDELFAKIDKAKANIEKNLENVEGLFQRILNDNFSASADDEAGKYTLPNDWIWVTLGDICEKLTDGTHNSPPNYDKGDFKYITAKNIKPDGVDLSNVTYVSKEIHTEIYSRCNPVKGDILFIKDGATTGVVTINNLDEEFSLLSSVALIKLQKNIDTKFIVYVIRSPVFQKYIQKDMDGAAITRMTLKKLARFPIPLPPLEEQKAIVAALDELKTKTDALKDIYKQKMLGLEELRKAVLEKAFKGELV